MSIAVHSGARIENESHIMKGDKMSTYILIRGIKQSNKHCNNYRQNLQIALKPPRVVMSRAQDISLQGILRERKT